MLFIKSINISVSPFYPLTFQGFNEKFYYYDKQGQMQNIDMAIVVYKTYDGVSYKSNTEKAWLCDEYVVNLGKQAYEFLCHLYSEHEIQFINNAVIFNFKVKHFLESIPEFEYEDKQDTYNIDSSYFDLIRQRRDEYNKFMLQKSFDNTK